MKTLSISNLQIFFNWHKTGFLSEKQDDMKAFKNSKIFVVDDNELTGMVFEQSIRANGFQNITCFKDGLSCLNALTDEPLVVFLDQNMDDMNGLEVLKKIKRFDPDIYVIFVSGQGEIETATSALKLGAFDYIVKGDDDTKKINAVLRKIEEIQDLLSSQKTNIFKTFLGLIV